MFVLDVDRVPQCPGHVSRPGHQPAEQRQPRPRLRVPADASRRRRRLLRASVGGSEPRAGAGLPSPAADSRLSVQPRLRGEPLLPASRVLPESVRLRLERGQRRRLRVEPRLRRLRPVELLAAGVRRRPAGGRCVRSRRGP